MPASTSRSTNTARSTNRRVPGARHWAGPCHPRHSADLNPKREPQRRLALKPYARAVAQVLRVPAPGVDERNEGRTWTAATRAN
ncbi:hypothetical protein DBZ45_09220 [Arthrobacter globiformis]|uniref:Uncharacterized protein n=1 Tax=Arthrobacter globiformis TaxID=1665 RepID=A0A328HGL1_ARTGO|nr:hypothetical protein DBZ45_09220 [Arthrobacter globiformis]